MAFSGVKLLLLVIFMIVAVQARFDQVRASYDLVAETLEWPWTMSVYDELGATKSKMLGLILLGGLCTGNQSAITYRMDLCPRTGFLVHLAEEGLITPTIVSKPDIQPTPTPEAAPESHIAGDRYTPFLLH